MWEKREWKLAENKIEEADSTTHIGIFREWRGEINDIESRLKKGWRTSHALLGASLHGENGISPYISDKLYITFCRPRMIYGLEAVQMLEGEKLNIKDCLWFRQFIYRNFYNFYSRKQQILTL